MDTVSGTHSCKHHVIDIFVMRIFRHSVASSVTTPWGSEPGWTLTFAPAQASGGQMRVLGAPEASTASCPPDEDEGQRAESKTCASPGVGSCLSQKFARAEHWSNSKLRNGEAHCFSSVGGIARSHVREHEHWGMWKIAATNSSPAATH